MTPNEIRTVLGDSKSVTCTWPDGSFECPYCCNPIIFPSEQCANPWCDAHPSWTREALAKRREEQAAKEREAEDRRNLAEWQREWVKDQRESQERIKQEEIARAEEGGYCLRCLHAQSWRSRFIRHRKKCPRE
jgi:hypothetical protein